MIKLINLSIFLLNFLVIFAAPKGQNTRADRKDVILLQNFVVKLLTDTDISEEFKNIIQKKYIEFVNTKGILKLNLFNKCEINNEYNFNSPNSSNSSCLTFAKNNNEQDNLFLQNPSNLVFNEMPENLIDFQTYSKNQEERKETLKGKEKVIDEYQNNTVEPQFYTNPQLHKPSTLENNLMIKNDQKETPNYNNFNQNTQQGFGLKLDKEKLIEEYNRRFNNSGFGLKLDKEKLIQEYNQRFNNSGKEKLIEIQNNNLNKDEQMRFINLEDLVKKDPKITKNRVPRPPNNEKNKQKQVEEGVENVEIPEVGPLFSAMLGAQYRMEKMKNSYNNQANEQLKNSENLKGKNKRLSDFEEIDEMEKQKIGKKSKIPDVGERFSSYL
uniref:Uncharacterized protein n=1 Tax=Meloidogyne floridensis TaxID=298350 RepID=A0A915NKJ7_9BILA